MFGTGFGAAGTLRCLPERITDRGDLRGRVFLEPQPMPQSMGLMDCRSFRKHHFAYLDDTLSGDDMAAAQRHILACNGCAAHDTLVRRSLMMAKSMPMIEPSAAFQQKLKARLAECREERAALQAGAAMPTSMPMSMPHAVAASARFSDHRAGWFTPRTLAAIAASAVVGTLVWRGTAEQTVPVVAMQPVIASAPARPEVRYVSPALLQAMATGNPVWPATVVIEEASASGLVNVGYSMTQDDR